MTVIQNYDGATYRKRRLFGVYGSRGIVVHHYPCRECGSRQAGWSLKPQLRVPIQNHEEETEHTLRMVGGF